jgi:hypothetical protein
MMKRKSTQKQTVVVQVYSSKKSTGYRSKQKQWFWDHIEYMPHRSFMCVTDMVISPAPTPAVRPKGRTLSSVSGPCLSLSTWLRIDSASWSALLRLASLRSHEARRGVKSFGAFCRNKNLACRDETRQHENITLAREWDTRARHSPANTFYRQPPRWIPHKAVRPEPSILYDPVFHPSLDVSLLNDSS